MNVENDMPQAFIIAETKMNAQSTDSAIEAIFKKKWSDEWKKRNMNSNMTDMEKIPESIAEITGKYVNNKKVSTEDYNKSMLPFITEENIFSHVVITIAFVNVTRDFCFSFRDFGGKMTVGDVGNDITFWVPPSVSVDEKLSVDYGMALNDLGQRIETMRASAFKNKLDAPEKINQVFDNLYPNSISVNAVATGTLVDWKKFILSHAHFHSIDESRYVLMNLARTMKMKWSSLFYDVVVEDAAGKQYGMDTISSAPLAYKALRLSIKKP
jgi:hypothetical protein